MISGLKDKFNKLSTKQKQQYTLVFVLFVVLVFAIGYQVKQQFFKEDVLPAGANPSQNAAQVGQGAPQEGIAQDANDIYAQTLELQGANGTKNPPSNTSAGAPPPSPSVAEVLPRQPIEKRVVIPVADSGRSNPFLPAAENVVPSSLPKFSFSTPPEQAMTGSTADRVMSTTISGILYDKYSPSAIINISGMDYLVKKGDVINGYKVLAIAKDQVVVQLGSNVYRAGVGQILAQGPMNYNVVSNLDKKFGGNDIAVNVKKKARR